MVSFNLGVIYPDVRILEYSGVDAVSPLDVVAKATGTGGTSNSGNVTTTSPTDLLLGATSYRR
jgi:hypothetical protein